jgi:hypothetical protein
LTDLCVAVGVVARVCRHRAMCFRRIQGRPLLARFSDFGALGRGTSFGAMARVDWVVS